MRGCCGWFESPGCCGFVGQLSLRAFTVYKLIEDTVIRHLPIDMLYTYFLRLMVVVCCWEVCGAGGHR